MALVASLTNHDALAITVAVVAVMVIVVRTDSNANPARAGAEV
jgi:hypothetical protein